MAIAPKSLLLRCAMSAVKLSDSNFAYFSTFMILDDIVTSTQKRVALLKDEYSLLQLEKKMTDDKPRPFQSALKHESRLALIAEIKRASPSKGLISPNFDVEKMAALYRDGGADCLSVLTEPDFFQGHNDYLKQARDVSGLPVLRKDFIISDLQIAEARLLGADCILLIAAILRDWEIRAFKHIAARYGMDALVEIHDEAEAQRALVNGCDFVGINNRNLKTFEVDLSTTERLRPLLPANVTVVAESGISTRSDAQRLRSCGANALLVGESLMKSGDVNLAIRDLLEP